MPCYVPSREGRVGAVALGLTLTGVLDLSARHIANEGCLIFQFK